MFLCCIFATVNMWSLRKRRILDSRIAKSLTQCAGIFCIAKSTIGRTGAYMPRPGEKVLVPTKVSAGTFPSERLVSVETPTGIISGFARADMIVDMGNGTYLVGEVKAVSGSTSAV